MNKWLRTPEWPYGVMVSLAVTGMVLACTLVDLFMPRRVPPMPQQMHQSWDSLWVELRQSGRADSLGLRAWTYRAATYARVLNLGPPYPGHYPMEGSLSTWQWMRLMASGRQTPVRLVWVKFRTTAELASFLGRQLRADSSQWQQVFMDSLKTDSMNLGPSHLMSLFLPNTYQVYWTVRPASMVARMSREFEKFWNQRRRSLAARQGLNPWQATILASIVEEESQYAPERPRIAGVYLNRLRLGMPLQADPTLKFAIGQFALRRIGKVQMQFPSPYNTYLNTGLPPGPICTPSPSSIESVLNAENHSYLYFCADPGQPGQHLFARHYPQHLAHARRYHAWLSRRGIR